MSRRGRNPRCPLAIADANTLTLIRHATISTASATHAPTITVLHLTYQFQGASGGFPFRIEIPAGQVGFPYGYGNTLNITTG